MKTLFSPRTAALTLAMVTTFSLTACQMPAKKVDASAPVVMQPSSPDNLIQRELGEGLYEMAYLPAKNALYVASAQGFKDISGGMIYRLDASTLQSTGAGHFDLKNFGLISAPDGSALYATNTLDGGISKIDPDNGKVLKRLMFDEKNEKGLPYGTREIFLHDGLLYVGGVGDPGVIWVVDAKTLTLKNRIKNAGKWVTGIIFSPVSDRIYAANGSGEILVINPRSARIEQRLTAGDGQEYLFLNMAEDPATGRLFVTDNSKAKNTLVFDERSGKVIKRLNLGDSLGIKFNGKRNEIYISQRESKKVLQLDGTTYEVKNSWSFDSHPNSLLVSPDGQTLFVTLKQGFNDDRSSQGLDGVARITLQ
ncbi:YncE family protein [Pantoea agglomerans]|uniref:DNA-binding beta-propeller fold protein YncE n=2 Tax=Enterobacter agglomerans TaxID=549 RepID=A0ABD6XU88_ENTAG|nr:YncE family protein [Pantoea agglomerans]WNK53229.1 YncE family protein [Pantoea agglomerans]WNK71199.1 YncE family protein [Pantoea agglomerans]